MNKLLLFSPPNEDGQYEVMFDLSTVLNARQIDEFETNLKTNGDQNMLPSTSPAHAKRFEGKLSEWREVKNVVKWR